MDIRLMEYVLAVYEERSFTKAADKLHVSQPSLSQQVAKLERELGLRLFQRVPGPISPTVDGRRFVERAYDIVHLRNDLRQEMQERSQGMGNRLSIGTTAITGGRLLPELLRTFHAAHPGVQLRLVEESTETLVDLAARGLVDIAVLPLPLDHPALEVIPILTEPLLLAIPPSQQAWMTGEMRVLTSGGLESVTPVSLQRFAAAPFVLLKQGYGFRRTVLQLCADNGFQPYIAFETGSVDTAQAMVAHGLGVTVVPQMVTHVGEGLTPLCLPLDSGPTRTLVFAYPRDRYLSLAARALIDLAL